MFDENVIRLRKETGTGMMDCKKALKNCGNNYELAKEYLHKYPNGRRGICGRLPVSRENLCEYCKKDVCENTFDSESKVCQNCFVRKCMSGKDESSIGN